MKPTEKVLLSVIKKWNLSKELEFIRKVENWIYKDNENKLFVRITEPSHRSLNQLNSELYGRVRVSDAFKTVAYGKIVKLVK